MTAAEGPAGTKPPIGVDLDGVVVRPPFGWNISISRRVNLPLRAGDTAEAPPGRQPSFLRSWLEMGRYRFRRPMPQVKEAFAELASVRDIHVVSARSHWSRHFTEHWLERHGLLQFVTRIHLKPGQVPSPHYKLDVLQRLGIKEHIDDDGATADYLARHGGITVYLCDWPRNRGLVYPGTVQPVPDIVHVVRLLSQGS